jgi:uncharacterized membrane protein
MKLKQNFSDKVAGIVGSWRFIQIQSTVILFWIVFNTQSPESGLQFLTFTLHKFDPFPFIFLNLALSFQAAYTAPIIMMSQNRQSKIDREKAEADYKINRIAKTDVEHIKNELNTIHQKLVAHTTIKNDIDLISQDIRELAKLYK